MIRGGLKAFLYLLAFLAGVVFIATLGLWLLTELAGVPIPALEPFSSLLSVLVSVLLALASYLGARRITLPDARDLPWNWRWHRYRYLRSILKDPQFNSWQTDFAPLQLKMGREYVPSATVLFEGEREILIDVLKEVAYGAFSGGHHVLVLGDPGSGKTTGLKRLTWELAKDGTNFRRLRQPMPLLIRLGNFQDGSLLDFVRKSMVGATEGGSGRILSLGLQQLLEERRIVLLFDALDEALGQRREIVLAELGEFLARRDIRAPIVITARSREDPGGRIGDVSALTIQDLDDAAVKQFIQIYEQPRNSESDTWERLSRYQLLGPRGLGRNPFWLKLIIQSGAFQGNKAEILDQAVDQLLSREWEKPEVQRAWRRRLGREDQLEATKHGLASLALTMSIEGSVSFEKTKALEALQEWLANNASLQPLQPQDILGLGRDAQILVYEPGPVSFRHRLLQEVMTAWVLTDDPALLTTEFIERYATETGWWETFILLGELTNERSSLIDSVLRDGDSDQRLFLAIGIMQEEEIPEKTLQEIAETLSRSTRSGLTADHQMMIARLNQVVGDVVVSAFERLFIIADIRLKETVIEIIGQIESAKAAEALIRHFKDEHLVVQAILLVSHIGRIAVMPLIGALGDESELVRSGAGRALGDIGEPAVEPLITALGDKSQLVRSGAVKALVNIGELAVGPLIAALGQKSGILRIEAVRALGEIGDKRAVEPLIAALGDESELVRISSAVALGEIGDEWAVGPLITALRDPSGFVRSSAAVALGEIGEPAVEPLITALDDQFRFVRSSAARALGEIGDKRAVGPLAAALNDQFGDVRSSAARALGEIGDERAVGPLIDALGYKSEYVHFNVTGSLMLSHYLDPLITALDQGSVRLDAVRALGMIGKPAIGPLIAALGHESEAVRLDAVRALGEIGIPAVESLIAALGHESGDVYSHVVIALGMIGVPPIEPLITALGHESEAVRSYAAIALGIIGDGRARRLLIDALDDASDVVCSYAAVALGKVGDERAVEPLIGALGNKSELVRTGAVIALRRIGDKRAVGPLIAALGDESQYVRSSAARALEEIKKRHV